MWQSILDILPNVMLGAALAGLVTFAVTYARNSDWRKTRPGRALMYMILSMIGVIAMSFAHLVTGEYPGHDYVRIAVYGSMTVAVWNIVSTLYTSLKLKPFWLLSIKRSRRRDR